MHTANTATLWRTTGAILLLQGLLMFAPLAILGAAINWPASLSEPASMVLPLISAQAGAVRMGYFIYLLYSILFWPTALLVVRVVARSDSYGPLLRIAAGFGIASAVARTLGIVRWLGAMPGLAAQYVDPATSDQTRATISTVFQLLNDYAGMVGEVLGVSFFAALWVGCVSIAILRSGALPRWVGWFGLLAGAGLSAAVVELFGVDLGPLITVTTTTIHLWFLGLGGYLLLRAPRGALVGAVPTPAT